MLNNLIMRMYICKRSKVILSYICTQREFRYFIAKFATNFMFGYKLWTILQPNIKYYR